MGRSLLKINGKVPNGIKSYNSTAIIKLKEALGPLTIDLDHFNISILTTATDIKSLDIGNYVGSSVSDIQQPTVSWDATSAMIKYKYGDTIEYDDVYIPVAATEYTAESSSFEQNPTDQPIIRNVTFTAVDGKTYTTTVTQKAYSAISYEITLEGIGSYGFVEAYLAMPNLDKGLYDGVYASNNKNIDNSQAVARIDFNSMPNFTVWINSYAESNYDYTLASELDASTYPTQAGSTAKASTQGFQRAIIPTATAPIDTVWKKVTYENDGGQHHIFIVYRKDSSASSNDDIGRFIVEVNG